MCRAIDYAFQAKRESLRDCDFFGWLGNSGWLGTSLSEPPGDWSKRRLSPATQAVSSSLLGVFACPPLVVARPRCAIPGSEGGFFYLPSILSARHVVNSGRVLDNQIEAIGKGIGTFIDNMGSC